MELRRKIESKLAAWKAETGHKPIVVKGCRQCGKTYSVLRFAQANYEHTVYMNFVENPDYASAFQGSKLVDDIVMNLSVLIPGSTFVPHKTCIVLDEIQDCPAARTSLKFFALDGRYDVVATGSLLGVKGYGEKHFKDQLSKASVPVGYEEILEMFPLDFEEFLWANGIQDNVINLLHDCLREVRPVPEAIHLRLRSLLFQYAIVGGMPAIVSLFISTHDMGRVLRGQRNIISEYEEDMAPRERCS